MPVFLFGKKKQALPVMLRADPKPDLSPGASEHSGQLAGFPFSPRRLLPLSQCRLLGTDG